MARYLNAVVLEDTGVIAGTFTNANIVVDRKGRIISATDGGPGGGGVSTVEDLTDTSIVAPVADEFLRFSGTVWTNTALSLSLNSDVSFTTPQSNDLLSFNGANWTNLDPNTAGFLTSASIGVTVQAFDAKLDGLAALSALPGVVVQTAAGTFANRDINSNLDGGIAVTNPDGVAGDIGLTVDITNAITENGLDSAVDLILFHDASIGALRNTTISNFIVASGGVTDGVNLGTGADIFIITTAGLMEFRGLDNSNSGIVITTTPDTISIGVNANLNVLGTLATASGNIIAGNGASWEVQSGAVARGTLGLGDIATRLSADFLELTGGAMTGAIAMGASGITGVLDPVLDQDAATKNYVDTTVATGIVAGAGLTKTGSTVDVINVDGSINIVADSIGLNVAFTDALYFLQTEVQSAVPGNEGAALVGTDAKVNLGNANTVEEALDFLDTSFVANTFNLDMTQTWNLDVGAPNVNAATVRDVEVARFEPAADTAIYRDLMLPPFFDATKSLTFTAAFAKTAADVGIVNVGLSYQRQQPGTNFPAPGPAPDMEFVADDVQTFLDNDIILHNLTWTIPGNTFQAFDVVTIRLSRLGTVDTFTMQLDFFAAYIIQDA